jgi:hypothetical protein
MQAQEREPPAWPHAHAKTRQVVASVVGDRSPPDVSAAMGSDSAGVSAGALRNVFPASQIMRRALLAPLPPSLSSRASHSAQVSHHLVSYLKVQFLYGL